MNGRNLLIETLAQEDFPEWAAFCGVNFNMDPSYFQRHFEADPHRCLESIFIIKDNGVIVSTVRVFQRHVWLGGKMVKMGGIGEVSTAEAYRKRGLSQRLLAKAVEYMRQNGFLLSMLGTGFFGHYERHGYRQVKEYRKLIGGGSVTCTGATLQPLSVRDFSAMSLLYDRYTSHYHLSVVRSPEYWRSWCAGEIRNPVGLFRAGRLAGYVCYDGSFVGELIGEPEDHDLLLSAVTPADGVINAPGIAQTKREIVTCPYYDCIMILLLRPLDCFGRTFYQTEDLVEYLNENGGINHWTQDGF